MALITKGKSHAKGEYASMDLTSVVGTLESHWVVLDAELAEIKKDIASLRCRAPPPQGRDLCYKLSNPGLASTIKTAPAQLQAQLAIEVVSPILANANNPLTVVR